MNRIAAGVLIAAGGIAMTGAFPPPASAAEGASSLRIERPADIRETSDTRGGTRILALLVTLEALRGSNLGATAK